MFDLLRSGLERLLEAVVILLVAALTLLIVAGFIFRYAGHSLTWYDEVASVGLAWLTYYGAALAALKGAHIGFPGLVNALPSRLRVAAALFSEACVFLFFGVLAWMGWEVLVILEGMTLTSLPSVPLQLTQSVIPVGAVLFMLCEALRLPKLLHEARGSGFKDHELEDALSDSRSVSLEPAAPAPTPAAPIGHTAVHGGRRA